jgi:hypothetical protein
MKPPGGVSNCGISVVGKDVSRSIKQDALQRMAQQAFREEECAQRRVLEASPRARTAPLQIWHWKTTSTQRWASPSRGNA